MREIKFRAWSELYKEMYYPTKAGLSGLKSYDILEKFENVMQFTGLKDKNGKEIYEGDVVHQDDYIEDWHHEIVFNNGKFIMEQIKTKSHNDYIPQGVVEIIGNIHQNKDLLI